MKAKTKKYFGLHQRNLLMILSAMLILFSVCLSAYVTADAAGGTQIGVASWDELKAALSENTDSDIVITKALGDREGHKELTAELMVYGHHTLDLNGHDIDVSWGDDDGEAFGEQYLFYINKGASLTVNDSSGDNSGMIRAHAYMTTATAHIRSWNTEWTEQNEGQFNDFYVEEGASLIINGGEIAAGRHKGQWITNVPDVGAHSYGSAIGASYTGDADQVKGGTCVVAGEGSFVQINGGTFYSRDKDTTDKWGSHTNDAMFQPKGATGTFIINGGEFYSITDSDIFDSRMNSGWDVKVNAGYFKCDYLNRIWYTRGTEILTFGGIYFDSTQARTTHGYSGLFNIDSSWLPRTASGQLACSIDYDGVICSDTAAYNKCKAENTDGREIRTLTITPKNGTSASIKAVDSSFHQYVGKEGTIRFEDQDFYFADMDFEGAIGAYLGNCGPSIKLVCFVTYTIQEWEDGKYNGSVSFSQMADGVQLGPKQGLSLSKYQKWANDGGIKWEDGDKKGQNAVLEPNNRYEVYATFKYYMSNNDEFYYQILRSELPFGFIYENGIEVETVSVDYKGLNVAVEKLANRSGQYVVPGVVLSDAVMSSKSPEVTGIRILNVLENGKHVGEDVVLKDSATYEIYLELTAAEGYALNRYTQVQFDFDSDFTSCMCSKDNKVLTGWVKFRTVCEHEFQKDDEATHTCVKCKETGGHDFGALKRIDANTQERVCETCGYQDIIKAQAVSVLSLNTAKVLTAGDAVPDLSVSFDDLKRDGVVNSFTGSWYYYGTEEPGSNITTTALNGLEQAKPGDSMKEGYYIVTAKVTLTSDYVWGAYHALILPAVGSRTLKVDGNSEVLADNQKTLSCAECVKVVPQINANLTLPRVQEGMSFAQFAQDLTDSIRLDKTVENYSVVITAYPDEEKVTDAIGTAVYDAINDGWTYLNGSLFTGKEIAAKDTFVFTLGESYDIRVVFTPFDKDGNAVEVSVNPVVTGSNEVNVSYENELDGFVVKTIYSVDKNIRMVDVNTSVLKLGDDVTADAELTVSENVNVMQLQWLVWDEAAQDYVETKGKATCGNLYRKTVILTTDNQYDAYQFSNEIKVLLNGSPLLVDGEYSSVSECYYITSSRLAIYIYADYRHDLEFVKTLQEASCTQNREELYVCKNCKQEVKFLAEMGGHYMVEIPNRPATCSRVGVRRVVNYCVICEKYFDLDGTEALEGQVFLSVDSHNHEVPESSFEYLAAETGHKLVCPSCRTGNQEEEAHHFAAVSDENGNVIFGAYRCDVCEYMYGDLPSWEKFAIYSQPKDTTAYYGDTTMLTFLTTGEGVTYQWQYKNAGTTTWQNMTTASAKASTLEFIVTTNASWKDRQFRCVATDKTGATLTSETVTLTVLAKTLPAPVITGVSNEVGGVEVKWNAVAGAEKYRVLYRIGSGAWTSAGETTETNKTVAGLTNGITYTFTVRCVSADGKVYTSNYDPAGKSITYKRVASTMLAAPVISGLSSTSNGVQVTWGAVSGAAQYRVFYRVGTGAWTTVGNTAGTSKVVTGLTGGTTYTFLVRCLSADGKAYESDYDASKSKSITYITQPAVSSLSNAANGVEVKWNAVPGAAQYRVFFKADSGAWTGYGNTKETGMTVTGLTAGTTYSFTVRCLSADGKTYTSTYDTVGKSIVYQPTSTMLAKPEISSLNNTANGVEVKWNAVPGAAQYRVFYKAAGGAWTGFGNTKETGMIVTGLTAGTTYSFTVRCLSADGKTYTSNYDTTGKSIVYRPAAGTMLAKPEITALSSNSAGVQVTWGAVSGAAQYRVFYKTATGAWTTFGNTTGTSLTVTGLTSGTTYTFLVRCLSADGRAYTSDYDAAMSKSHTYIAQPAVSSVTNTSAGVEVKWNAVGGAAQYRVFYKPAGGAWIGYKNTTGTGMVVTGLTKGTTYSFTVRCLSADGKTYTSTYDTTGKSIKVE